MVLVRVRVLVSVQPPPEGLAWELPAVRELLRELSALWAQLGV